MSNTLTYVTPQLLAQGVLALREMAVMPRLVNRDYESLAAQKGAVVNIPIPSAITARSVTAAVTWAANQDFSPTTVAVTLDRWYEATFQLSDSDALTVVDGTMPMQASEAIRALANDADKFILGKHIGFISAAGTPATTPFATNLAVHSTGRKQLNLNETPVDNRRAVLDAAAEAAFMNLAQISDADKRGDQGGIILGTIGRKLGIDWYMDQNVPSYTAGTGWASGFIASTVSGSIGDTTLNLINATASGTIKKGDIFSLVADTAGQQYVVTTAATASATVAVAISFYPALKTTVATGATLTVVSGTYVANLLFHRDAFVFASRPLQTIAGVGNIMQSPLDPISGMALRLEIARQYKQTTYSYDYLGGAAVVRPEFGCKLCG